VDKSKITHTVSQSSLTVEHLINEELAGILSTQEYSRIGNKTVPGLLA